MNEMISPTRVFPAAREDAAVANRPSAAPQTQSPAYRLAFQDEAFLLREDLRPVRFQLELMKPELLLDEAGIASTFAKPIPILFFGREFWERAVGFEFLVEEGVISVDDLKLFRFAETAEEGWGHICDWYSGSAERPC